MARPRTYDEHAVIAGAVELFRERGYRGTSVPELTSRLGICRQSLYVAFGGKRGLYLRALEAGARRDVDARLGLLGVEGSPLENVRTVVRGLAALAATSPDDGPLTVRAIVEARQDPEVTAVVEGEVARLEQGLTAALRDAQDRGELPSTTPAERWARALTTAYYGIGLMARLPSGAVRIADSVSVLLGCLATPSTGESVARPHASQPSPEQRFEPGI